jgi:polyhydroxybutyrate depolymerase
MLIRAFLALAALLGAAPAWASCTLPAGQRTIQANGRSVLVHIPVAAAAKRVPLAFLLHGSNGSGRGHLEASQFAAAAERHGFAVAAPDGGIPGNDGGFVWNIPGVPTFNGALPGPGAADDLAMIAAVIDRLVALGCADRARVYSTGFSGGGRMSSMLACRMAGRIAAIAPVVGLRAGNPDPADPMRPDPATCVPSRPVPVLAFAGGADTTNPIAGGGGPHWRYGMEAALARWAAIDGCKQRLPPRRESAELRIEEYAGCRGGATVQARIEEKGGHVWRRADNDRILTFFARHRLPGR